jgi:uncharacterized protein GlcG (DUF336 family)
MTITLEQARTIVAAAFAHGAASQMRPLCVAVRDAGGHLVAFERQDSVAYGRFDIAAGKARGAIAIGVSSRQLGVMATERPHFVNGVSTVLDGGLVPVAGGVIVIGAGGEPIGAVGISGDTSDNDEEAALAGIAAAGLQARS